MNRKMESSLNATDLNITNKNTCEDGVITGMDTVSNLTISSVLTLCVALTITLNVVVIIKVNFRPKHKHFTRFFLTSLSSVDLCVGLTIMPFSIANEWTDLRQVLGHRACALFNSGDVMLTSASIIHLSILTFERYIALCRPFSYQNLCSRKSKNMLFIICWVIVGSVSFGIIIPGYHHLGIPDELLNCYSEARSKCKFITNYYYAVFSSAISFFFPGILIFCCNLRVLKHIRKQSTRRKYNLTGIPYRSRKTGSESQSMRVARTIACLTVSFFVCWLPFFIVNEVSVFMDYNIPFPLYEIVLWLGYVNSAVNPALYLLLEGHTCIGRR